MIFRILVTIAAIPLCGAYMEGIHVVDMTHALLLGGVLALIYMVVRPVARLMLSVLNFCTLGLLYVVVDAWLVWTAASLLENSLIFDNFWWAVAMAAAINSGRFLIDLLTGRRK